MTLKVTNLSKSYDGRTNALYNVNFEISGAGLILITGDNGSGKTTLFNLIAGLDKPTHGNVIHNQNNVGSMKEKQLREYRRNSISYIFQDFNLIDDLSVYENLALVVGNSNRQIILDVLNKVGIYEFKDKKAKDLSGGQKQRLAIARAFVKDSSIVLADEITASLDKDMSSKIVNLLVELAKTKCVIVITHNKEKFKNSYNREIRLEHGQLVYDNSLSTIQYSIEEKKTNKINAYTLYRFAWCNLLKRKSKKIYLLIFSILLLTVSLVSVSSITANYKPMVANILSDIGQRYISCTASPEAFDGVDYLVDNNYDAVTNLDYNLPAKKDLFWLPMHYGRSEHVIEINSKDNNIEIVKGRFPNSLSEIAITDYVADYILAHGSKEKSYGTYDDIIGSAQISLTYLKNSYRLQVVGIIETDYKKFKNLQDLSIRDLSYALDDTYYNASIRWKLNEMLDNCSTDKDRQYYLFVANALNYYNAFYVCNDYETLNYNVMDKLHLADNEANKHNLPALYTINRISNMESKIYYTDNGIDNGVVAPLSKILDANILNDLFAVHQNVEGVLEDCRKKNLGDITVQIKEMTLKPLESFESNRKVYSQTFNVIGFYDDFFNEEYNSNYYFSNNDFGAITSALSNYTPSAVTAYIDFTSISDKEKLISAILGDFVPNGNMSFPEKSIVDDGYAKLKIMQAVFIAVFAILIALSVGFLAQIIFDDIKENEKSYAIMKSLGLSNAQLIGIAIFTPLILFASAAVVAILLSFAFIALLNVWLINGFMDIAIVKLTGYGVLGLIGTMAVSLTCGVVIGLRKLIKQPPIKSLKTN